MNNIDKQSTHKPTMIVTIVVILLFWYISTNMGWVDTRMLPTPQAVWSAFIDILFNGYKNYTLLQHLGSSMYRLFAAFILAAITGTVVGLASGYVPKIGAIFDPIIEFYRPLPPLAYYTLLVLWMGIENESKIALLYLACLPPIYIACSSAVRGISPIYLQSAATLGANKKQTFMYVIFPSCLPSIFVSLRTSLGVGYSTLVAAEMVAATSGIGWMVLDASNYLRSDIVFAGIFIMSFVGIIVDQALRLLEKKVVPWKGLI